jgi:FKBP-type peptidyl-prolyl cis-trans isomerase
MQMNLNEAAVVRGVADARLGSTALMSEKAMRSTLIELKQKIQEHEAQLQIDVNAEAKGLAVADTPTVNAPAHARRAAPRANESAREFFVKNAQQQGMVTLPSGLQYRVLKEGAGRQPRADDKVALVYRGALIDGNEFGNTEQEGKPFPKTFSLAALVPGMREAVMHMKEGDQWQVFVPPNLGFDASTPLYRKVTVFDVRLVAVNP